MISKKEILKERAKKLAQGQAVEDKGASIEVVVFNLGNERYGLESIYIKEVYPLKDLTPLPNVPSFVLGMITVRRKLLSVIDLKIFFDISTENKIQNSKIIILEGHDMEFAISTDGIKGILFIPVQSLQTSLPTLTGIRQEFLKGITVDGLIVLDGEKLLTSQRLIVNEPI